MSISMQYDIIGGKELEKALRDLGAAVGQKGGPVKLALKAAAVPVLDEMQMGAAKHFVTGVLYESLSSKRHPNPLHLNEIYGVGVHTPGKKPPKGEDQNTGKAWYAQVVEYGGWHKAGPLKGFMRRALENNRKESTDIYSKRLAIGINRIAKKEGNKNAQAVAAKVRALHQ
jgi:hypothetical protein